MSLKDLIELSRPTHWVKGVFVFMPVPFGLASGAALDPARFALGFAGFSLVASAVYALNDTLDAEKDALHPDKRDRPVASGRVPPRVALVWSASLLLAGIGLTLGTGLPGATATVVLYGGLNLVYCLGGRNLPLIDVFLLSSGFVLRVLLGCVLLQVPASGWLLLCSSALALFLALAKRRADLLLGVEGQYRPSLAGVSTEFLEQAMGITATLSILSYSIYCLETPVFVNGRQFASVPFVIFGVLDYLRVAQVKNVGGAPVEFLLRSPRILVCGVGWGLGVLFSLGFP